jgi:hypothetical protein
MPGVFPDYPAPIVRNGANGRELAMARWGMPSSQHALMEATKKRAAKLEAKGKPVDFKQLIRKLAANPANCTPQEGRRACAWSNEAAQGDTAGRVKFDWKA